ncbi:agmatine deiminase family protein [Streptomyces parvus]
MSTASAPSRLPAPSSSRSPLTPRTPTTPGCGPTGPSWRSRPTPRAWPLTIIDIPQTAGADIAGTEVEVSYLNFYLANGGVVVPVAGGPQDEAALQVIAGAFPGRKVVGVTAPAIAYGGGGVHCITQQIPAAGPTA